MSDQGPNPSGFCMCGCGQKTPIAPKTRAEFGWVKGQPIRYIKGHCPRGKRTSDNVDPNPSGLCECGCGERTTLFHLDHRRFVKGHQTRKSPVEYIVDPETGCWEWQRAKDKHGYGRMDDGGSTKLAHRIFWERAHGPTPDGLNVLHHCDNPPCVNPAHLFLGTQEDNMQDAAAKGRIRNKYLGKTGGTPCVSKG